MATETEEIVPEANSPGLLEEHVLSLDGEETSKEPDFCLESILVLHIPKRWG